MTDDPKPPLISLLAEPEPSPDEKAPEHEALDKRALWGEGPWEHEPDRVEFLHRGVPCLMLRNDHFGNWNGYAGVEPGHPWHGLDRDDDLLEDVQEPYRRRLRLSQSTRVISSSSCMAYLPASSCAGAGRVVAAALRSPP